MAFFQKLFGQTAVYGLSTIVGRLLNYLLVPLYLRILNPGEYGVVVDFYAYAAFGGIVFLYGMETAFFRYSKEGKEKSVYSEIFSSVLFSSLLIAAMLFLFRENISIAAGYAGQPEYVLYFAGILFLDAISAIPFARLRKQNRAFKFASIKVFNIAINIGLNLFFLLVLRSESSAVQLPAALVSIFDNTDLPAFIFISNLIANFLSSILLIGTWPSKLSLPSMSFLKTLLSYSFPLMIVGLSGMVNEVIDRILLKALLPMGLEEAKEQVGIYGAVYKIATLMTILTQTFRMGAEPFFFEQAKRQNSRKVYARLMEYFVSVSLLFFVVVMVFLAYPDPIFKDFTISRWMIGLNFTSYYEGLMVVPILFLANILFGIYYNLSVWYKLSDKTHYAALISIGGALVTILGNIISIPKYGYVGSAWTTLFCFLLMVIASYLLGRKHFKIPYRIGRLLILLLSSVLVVMLQDDLFRLLNLNSVWLIFVLKCFICILFALFTVMLLKLYKIVISPLN